MSDGNAIKLLVDGLEAFGRIADEIKLANHSINITELFFALPDKFDKDNEAIDPGIERTKREGEARLQVFPDSAGSGSIPIYPVRRTIPLHESVTTVLSGSWLRRR